MLKNLILTLTIFLIPSGILATETGIELEDILYDPQSGSVNSDNVSTTEIVLFSEEDPIEEESMIANIVANPFDIYDGLTFSGLLDLAGDTSFRKLCKEQESTLPKGYFKVLITSGMLRNLPPKEMFFIAHYHRCLMPNDRTTSHKLFESILRPKNPSLLENILKLQARLDNSEPSEAPFLLSNNFYKIMNGIKGDEKSASYDRTYLSFLGRERSEEKREQILALMQIASKHMSDSDSSLQNVIKFLGFVIKDPNSSHNQRVAALEATQVAQGKNNIDVLKVRLHKNGTIKTREPGEIVLKTENISDVLGSIENIFYLNNCAGKKPPKSGKFMKKKYKKKGWWWPGRKLP